MVTENQSVPLPPDGHGKRFSDPLGLKSCMEQGIDRNLYEWDDVCCPQCGKSWYTVNASVVSKVQSPHDTCDCGFSGPSEWINPDFENRQALARARLGAR
jgi:predicted RNA-binding Zn-ribbon protein involved in translation (DUF1610 family)